MPTDREQLYTALRNADAAGDTAAAQKLAGYIKSLPPEDTAPPPDAALDAAAAPQGGVDNFLNNVVADTASDLLGAPADFAANVLGLGKAAAGTVGGALGLPARSLPDPTPPVGQRQNMPLTADWFKRMAREHGLASAAGDPTSTGGRVLANVLEGAGGAAVGGIPSAIKGAGGSLPALLAAIARAAGGGATSSAAGQAAGEAANAVGAPDGADQAAAAVGAMLPGGARQLGTGISERVRRGLVGKADVNANAQRAREAGMSPDPAAAAQSRFLGALRGSLGHIPGAASVMDEMRDRRNAGVGGKVAGMVDELHPGGTTFAETGGAVLEGITNRVKRFRENVKRIFERFDATVHPQREVRVTNYRAALRKMAGPVKGAEATGRRLSPDEARGLLEDLETDLAAVEGRKAPEAPALPPRPVQPPPGASLREKRAYQAGVVKWNRKVKADKAKAKADAQKKESVLRTTLNRKGAKLERTDHQFEVERTPVRGAKDTLPYSAVAGIRSKLGAKLDDLLLSNKKEYRALYKALSDDIRGALSPRERVLWDRANKYVTAGHDLIDETLQPLADMKLNPEKVTRSLLSGTKDGASKLRRVMKSLSPEQRKEVSALVLSEMAAEKPHLREAGSEGGFNMTTFATRWNSLHEDAKQALFPGAMRKDMDTIAKAIGDLQRVEKGTHNPSGTSRAWTHAGFYGVGVGNTLLAIFTGHPGAAAATVGALASEAVVMRHAAKLLTSEKFVHWLAQAQRAKPTDMASYAAQLLVMQQNEKDPEMIEALDALHTRLTAPDAGGAPEIEDGRVLIRGANGGQ